VTEFLQWPLESASAVESATFGWSQSGSNIALDFHGDPVAAAVTVLSDGNHHMALEETLSSFVTKHSEVKQVFYVTLPPQLLLQIISSKVFMLGNLRFPIKADIILSPAAILKKLTASGDLLQSQPFIKNKGNVLLVARHNPKNISGVEDLFRDDVRIFISNAKTETASHIGYRETLVKIANEKGLSGDKLENWLDAGSSKFIMGNSVHHREAPQALFENRCDVAIVYYHLALRYSRIFPDLFEFVHLDDGPSNVVSTIHMGELASCGPWSKKIYTFLQSQQVKDIYIQHGLQEI